MRFLKRLLILPLLMIIINMTFPFMILFNINGSCVVVGILEKLSDFAELQK